MNELDDMVVNAFFKNQLKLFPKQVAMTRAEAKEFLEECYAVVVNSPKDVLQYFVEEDIDTEGADEESILAADEVFAVGDGRYLIVEA
ncbi:MAG: glyoxalase [Lachnospiraceae bacterium]|nr:glyoxalase [Candidatus Colinaster equi]